MSDIIDKIRKLLKLAEGSPNEHEAANAAARARALMLEYELGEAELRIAEPSREAEPIEERFELTDNARRVAWHSPLVHGVARLYGCHSWIHGGARRLFGRKSAVQAASYTFAYLTKEIERLAEQADRGGRADRSFRNAFRFGAAQRVRDRIIEQVAAEHAATPVPNIFDPTIQSVSSPPAASTALAIVQRDQLEVDSTYDAFARKSFAKDKDGNVKSRIFRPKISSGSGYEAGVRAGDKIAINGGRGLKAPTSELKGGRS